MGSVPPRLLTVLPKTGSVCDWRAYVPYSPWTCRGLDTVNNVSKDLYKTTGSPTYNSFKVIEEKISQGDLGVKTGKDFYEYETAGSTEFWDRTNKGIISTLKAFANRSLV